eukprot:12657719-Alexandrium_andersonii.AAC.1
MRSTPNACGRRSCWRRRLGRRAPCVAVRARRQCPRMGPCRARARLRREAAVAVAGVALR